MFSMRSHLALVAPLIWALPGSAAEAPLQVGRPFPPLFDLQDADPGHLVPTDPRDPAQVEAARLAWQARIVPLKDEPVLRLRLPLDARRWPLLLAASQALKAQNPDQRLYLAHAPGAPACWDEALWGALDGGALGPEDLGPDPTQWRDRLAKAQEQLPGRPWRLWLPVDPGALISVLLGDGGRIVVPPGGPGAKLAEAWPLELQEIEGGMGDLTLRSAVMARRWRFEAGAWKEASLPQERNEVSVTGKATYDVGALMAKVRALQLRSRAGLRSLEADLTVDLHLQGDQGTGGDLGYSFRTFEKAGEGEELLQEEIRFNGVKANLSGDLQLPILEPRTALAVPVAVALTERFRYRDGGPLEPGQRRVIFEPVDKDPQLPSGELRVVEASGAILEERSNRTQLPGVVKAEFRILSYGEVQPGIWRVAGVQSFERWATAEGVVQVQRRLRFGAFRVNDSGFEVRREEARASKHAMMKQTVEGVRYFKRGSDGQRRIEQNPRSSVRAVGGFLLVQPGSSIPVFPAAGLVYFDFNAFQRGIQISAITALAYNNGSVFIPNLPGGFDLGINGGFGLLSETERPVRNGGVLDSEGVGRRSLNANLQLGHDLGWGFRLQCEGRFQHDHFNLGDEKYRTPGFELPPSGWTREARGTLSWQARGFQLAGFYGSGRRPEGTYGTLAAPQVVPEDGGFARWGGRAGYDWEFKPGFWLHGEAGAQAGRAFDRFKNLAVGGFGAEAPVPGIKSGAIAADRLGYGQLALVLPTGPRLRLSTSLTHARMRSLDDQKTYGFTGLGLSGDLPGFGWFTTVRIDLGVGIQSDIKGVKTVNGIISLLRVF